MSAGTWTTQNKVRPGVYMNMKGSGQSVGELGERGITTIPLLLSWGPEKQVVEVEAGANPMNLLGYPLTALQMLLVKEALKHTRTLLVYRVNTGTKASGTDGGSLTLTAKYGGVRGNDITVTIQRNVDDASRYEVTTYVDGMEADKQLVPDMDALQNNDWVHFSGTGELAENAGIHLTGGSDGVATNQDYADYLEAVEVHDFNTIALPSTDTALKSLFVAFCKRLREQEGKKVQVVLDNYPSADYEGVISVRNGVVLEDGTTLTPAQCTAWVAGATAGAEVNESLTYAAYDGAVDVAPRLTNSQTVAALRNGEFVFTAKDNKAVVEQDINALVSFTPDKPKLLGKNRVIRVLDGINNDFVRIFTHSFIGKVNNNEDGRNLFKGECISYLATLQAIAAIQNFDSQSGIEVLPGAQMDGVYARVGVQPVDSIEKIYFDILVGGAA